MVLSAAVTLSLLETGQHAEKPKHSCPTWYSEECLSLSKWSSGMLPSLSLFEVSAKEGLWSFKGGGEANCPPRNWCASTEGIGADYFPQETCTCLASPSCYWFKHQIMYTHIGALWIYLPICNMLDIACINYRFLPLVCAGPHRRNTPSPFALPSVPICRNVQALCLFPVGT